MSDRYKTDLQNKYKDLVLEKRFAELTKLIATHKSKPNEYLIRLGYKTYIQESTSNIQKIFHILKLFDISDKLPDESVVKEICEIAISMENTSILEMLIRRMDIPGEVFKGIEPALQKSYSRLIEKGKFIDISRWMELTRISPAEEIVQTGYQSYLKEGKIISFTGLCKRTGIQPEKSMIQNILEFYDDRAEEFIVSGQGENIWIQRAEKLQQVMLDI